MPIKRPSGLTLLAGALLLLMPALAVLQFRWVGQVSDAEQGRMQRNVEIAAFQFREAFNRELQGVWWDLQVGAATIRDGARDGNWDRYAERGYERWVSSTSHPMLVKNVYLIDLVVGELNVRRWNPEERTFVTEPQWPSILAGWRQDFTAELQDFNAGRPPDRRNRFQDQDGLLIAQAQGPVRTTRTSFDPNTGARQQTAEQVFGFTVIELNLPYIQNDLLAELSQRHFTHPNGDSYRIAVISNDALKQVIYRSEPGATTDPARADATQGLYYGRLWLGPPRGGPQRPNAAADRRPGTADATPSPTSGLPAGGTEELPGRWRLLVQHQSGSVEAAVGAVRWRNLAISFGVLMLLTVSIGLLTVSSRRAQRLAQQQMEFVAGVSHELRTPVAVIKSAAENLSQGVVGNTERVKRYGQMIEGEARRLGEMVERVLQYAGIESGLGYGARSPLAPAEIVQTAIDSALPLLGPETIHIHRDIQDNLPAVIGDAAALRSAVQNLVANAVKYGGADRWVGIRAEQAGEHGRTEVRITVSDHGPGIPADELPRIFDPFYRGGDALSKQIHGNGLGLSLVKRIVAAHGGQVTVSTRAGAGSSFTISLPAAAPDASTSVASGVRTPVHT